jgi:hypothetical protein
MYRWVYRPSDGRVLLSQDWDDHPAYTKYHDELADEQWEPNLYYGNVFRIKDGWRVLDGDHNPVDDPFVKTKVMQALREEDGIPEEEEPDWGEPVPEAGFDRTHYGLPMWAEQN